MDKVDVNRCPVCYREPACYYTGGMFWIACVDFFVNDKDLRIAGEKWNRLSLNLEKAVYN